MSSGSGHGKVNALSRRIASQADTYAFLFDRLDVDFTEYEKTPNAKRSTLHPTTTVIARSPASLLLYKLIGDDETISTTYVPAS